MRVADELTRLERTARRRRRQALDERDPTRRVALWRSAEWHEHRAAALALPRSTIVGACGKRFRRVTCACGPRDVAVGCDQLALCPTCSKAHWRQWRKRITRAMDAHLTAERRAWEQHRRGMRPGIYLITFTMPHGGDIGGDRNRMGEAWRAITKVANARQWWRTFALTWEVTPGTRGDGHVHMHVAVISQWVPYDELREAWAIAMPGSIQPDVQAPKRRSGKAVQSCADYLAKYVTKGVDPAVFTGQKAGEMMAAFRGKRRVSTSLQFWKPSRDRETRCKHCECLIHAEGAPQGLGSILAGLRLHPRGWFRVGRRRDEQCSLRVDTG